MTTTQHHIAKFCVTLLAFPVIHSVSYAQSTASKAVEEENTGLSLQSGAGWLKGYLTPEELPDSLALLPPPPVSGSAAAQADVEAFLALTTSGALRRELALADAELRFPKTIEAFTCAVGAPITEAQTPNLYTLLRRTISDAAAASNKAKEYYQRTRPFVALKSPSCAPEHEESLAKNGSYPSGHTIIGWNWTLVLAEVSPERSNEILQRGYALGQSRAVCGAHWKSDVDGGYIAGAAVTARQHSNGDFRADLELARAEVAQLKAKGITADPQRCAAEARALGK